MWYGSGDVVISWLHSYLSDRFQSVKLDHCLSKNVTLPFGVPQGSVLGPLLFSLYTGPLSRVMLASQYLTTSTLMILSCIFPSQLTTPNPLSTAYSNALSPFRTG